MRRSRIRDQQIEMRWVYEPWYVRCSASIVPLRIRRTNHESRLTRSTLTRALACDDGPGKTESVSVARRFNDRSVLDTRITDRLFANWMGWRSVRHDGHRHFPMAAAAAAVA